MTVDFIEGTICIKMPGPSAYRTERSHRGNDWSVLVRGRLTLPFAMLVLLAPAGCSMQKNEALRAESPNHAVVATLIEEVGGGATVSTVYDLYLSSRNGGDRKLAFDATYCGGISLTWQETNSLLVRYYPGCAIHSFQNIWWSKQDIQSPRPLPPVEIILIRRPGAFQ
jgi:hypothetical protein